MNVVNREVAIDCVSTQLLIPSKHIVEVINIGYTGLLGDLLGVGNVDRGSTGILKWVVGSLRGDNDFGVLGLKCVDSIFHIFEVGGYLPKIWIWMESYNGTWLLHLEYNGCELMVY